MSSEKVLVAGVDTSTQSCKVRVSDAATGALVRMGVAKHPDGTSVNPQAWWDAYQEAVAQIGGLDDVAAVSVGGQQHGMVLLDDHGRVIRDALLWNDTRSAEQAEKLIVELGEEALAAEGKAAETPANLDTNTPADADTVHARGIREWVHAVGTSLIASITITKVRWVAENEPENARRIAAICLPHDWLTWRIAGYGPQASAEEGLEALSHLTTDRSDASGTGYFDPATNQYRRDLLAKALLGTVDAQKVILPEVISPAGIAGTADPAQAGKNVEGGCVLGAGGGDNAMASFGLSMGAGDVSISLGTSGVAAAVSPTPAYDDTGAVNGFADASGQFLPLACTINASRITNAGCQMLGTSFDEFAELAFQAQPGAQGVTLVPFFDGERTPNRPTASARLEGMNLANTTRENIARAFVEALLCTQRDCLEDVRALGVPVRRLLLIGGGARSAAVRKLGPSILGMEVSVPHTDEYVAIGAARQAAWALATSADPKAQAPAWPVEIDEVYPATDVEVGEKVYRQYVSHRG